MALTIDDGKLKDMIMKLLDRAGKNPRLTPRLLRSKAEERLRLEKDSLKSKRNSIKKFIEIWWNSNMKTTETKSETVLSAEDITLQSLNKLAKAIGKGAQFFKQISEKPLAEKIKILRKNLRDEGLQFSNTPTSDEIEKARKSFELKKELEEIDQSLVIGHSRKRGGGAAEVEAEDDQDSAPRKKVALTATSSGSSSVGGGSKVPEKSSAAAVAPTFSSVPSKTSTSTSSSSSKRVIADDSDGEAEF